ncbi:mannose-1-phosphate guanylyltransferase/mannose-6-phosphate isomerase [Pararhodospirillum oryzae]|uniref:mannose-1-phosphate guanylyltransferase n=1 Tax=Pararhodospirillum oryzae TaxID=478448 RepID=A0A512H7D6_9PROT|nr:mannose-1-phosphate guanylyltransferase/mannose-6-phosphate isomerase [Pararhodospirillum oryzae]GEO81366.1 mannose-1-phosphate guanylyltransferase/mannose-6-phosphate isomerase [Pararhodospirillum oryzae]
MADPLVPVSAGAFAGPMVVPVVLSGGAGTRLWPMSRGAYPKQFLPLAGENSLLQETLERLSGPLFHPPMVVCNEEHRFVVAEQSRAIGLPPAAIVLEPVGRNTAPAAAIAALLIRERFPGALALLAPSDHVITYPGRFRDIVAAAVPAARAGRVVTFGVVPDKPETGYGYIRVGRELSEAPPACAVERFIEKPDRDKAQAMLDQGGHLWNGGLFLFDPEIFLAELKRFAPRLLEGAQEALAKADRDHDFTRLDREAFEAIPGDSIDYAVMEHTDRAAVIATDVGWSDLGAWSALWDIAPHDEAGNVVRGDVLVRNTTNSYIRSEGPLVAVTGVDDLMVVATDDAVMVVPRERAQDVKALAEELKAQGRREHAQHTTVYRPWGTYRGIDHGERHQVKHIVVKPGGCLSLQMHHHRAEHWIVVRGTARVTQGERVFLLHENQSTYIPEGTVHRLENPGILPLSLIEVQSGSYLGEDDIVRFEDNYGRKEATS